MKTLTLLCLIALASPALAQMGGGMPMGGATGGSIAGSDPNKMSKGEEKKLAACQAMTPEDMAKDRRCVSLKKKSDRIAGRN